MGGLPKLVAGSDACKVAAVGGCAGKWGAEGWDSRKERGVEVATTALFGGTLAGSGAAGD